MAGKVAVFDILKPAGKIYTKVVANTKTAMPIPLIAIKVAPDNAVYTNCYYSYNSLNVSDFYHDRNNYNKLFGRGNNHINGIVNCWN